MKGEVKKVAIALWLLRSDITNPTMEDILQYAKAPRFLSGRKNFGANQKRRLAENI